MTTPQDGYTSFVSKALFPGLNPTSSATEAYLFGLNSSSSQPETPNSQLINQVLSLFKGCITSQLEEKDKQLEETAKIGKKSSAIKFFRLVSVISSINFQLGIDEYKAAAAITFVTKMQSAPILNDCEYMKVVNLNCG